MSDAIPLLDLGPQYEALRDEIGEAVARVLAQQRFILGAEVERFEQALAAYCGAGFAVGCASGSDALLLSLMALDVGPGDEVICPSYTFFATASAIWRLGARPVFADIDPVDYCLSPADVERRAAGCQHLKAVLPVHLFGRSADTAAIGAIAQQHGVAVVHDAAQAIGARGADGRRLGQSGELTCFSFFPSKNLGAYGDGGAVTTGDAAEASQLRALRVHGAHRKYFHDEVGLNSRLDALQAAVLSVKLPHLDAWDDARGRNADHYDARLREAGAADTTTPLDAGGLPLRFPARPAPPARHVFNQYVVRVPASARDGLQAHLRERGIGTAIYYPKPLHLQPCFAALGHRQGDLPESEAAARETLALPVFPELGEAAIDRVADEVIGYLRGRSAR